MGQVGDVACILADVSLRNTVTSALQQSCDTIDPESLMFEEVPGNFAPTSSACVEARTRWLYH